MTLFELKEKMAGLQEAIRADAEYITEKGADPEVNIEDLKAKEAHRNELQARFDMLKAEHDKMEAAQRERVEKNDTESSEDRRIKAKAAFYREAMNGNLEKAYEGLGAIPSGSTDLGYGEHLLPKNVSNDLITEPVEENSLRQVEPVTQITGLEEPRMLFSIEDSSLEDVTDKDTAKEIKMDGDTVSYGRFKTKIVATIKDTTMHGSDLNLVSTVEAALRSGLAIKEKIRAFAPATGAGAYDAAHKHMSFYAENEGVTEIKTVTGSNLIDAILAAWADLPEAFSTNAKCVMRKTDYYAEIRDLANGSESLFGKKPEDVLGIPVIFNDRAVTPVIGDFRYSKQNYDIDTTFETDKDGKKGEYYFILTAWGDHQIRLKSAFRLAKVNP